MRLIGLLTGLLLIAFTGAASAETWKLYVNARFGERAEYPADRFKPNPPPANGDGQSFMASDGATLAIFGAYNVDNSSPAEYEAFLRGTDTDYRNVTYHATGKDWLVMSGTRGDTIYYEKYLFTGRKSDAITNGLVVTYPSAAKATYDPIVARMAKSLRGR
jgi:hypothetical protein